MKRKLSALSQQYVRALKKHLKPGPPAGLQPALRLGRQAAALGLRTQELGRIHARALARLESAAIKNGMIRRAEVFFAEAVKPMEKFQRAALDTGISLNQVNTMLDRRTVNLAVTNRSLKQNLTLRKTVEKALRKSGEHSKKLLVESHRLQEHLQRLVHQVLSAQEGRRKKISHSLQDDIAQTLLGINVRLLTLKREAATNAESFKADVANTQPLVDKSIKSITRFARELNIHQPA